MTALSWAPTREAALARIAAIDPARYARSRNALDGAVSGLSPYITHGLVSLPEVLAGVACRHALTVQHKFVFELGWREYFHHVWQWRGDAILHSLHPGPLPEAAYLGTVPDDVRRARTGVPVIDQAVATLYTDGYLHNHARMWLASYLVHLRRVHWRAGADWMLGLLLDGDLASNHLSWQWVAGTGSGKPYLFNADNVARYAPPTWHSPNSAVDLAYPALDAIARGAALPAIEPHGEGVAEPVRDHRPPGAALDDKPALDVDGRDVWLVHPWALASAPESLPPDRVCLGWYPAEYHQRWGWCRARWQFVTTRMAALTMACGYGERDALARVLAGARSVHAQANPHSDRWLPASVVLHGAPSLFGECAVFCPSFSGWWKRMSERRHALTDLPGWVEPAAWPQG